MKPIDTKKIDTAYSVAQTAVGMIEPFAKVIANTSKTSVMRLTKDQIFQFPIIIDADIDDDDKFPIIKCLEKNYASIILIAIVNNGRIDRNKYKDTNAFLKKFHNNSNAVLESSYEVTSAIASEGYGCISNKELLDMWDCVEEQLDNESINSMYLPFKRTKAKLTRAIEAANLSIANEADSKLYFRRPDYKRDSNNKPITTNSGEKILSSGKNGDPMYQYIEAPSDENDFRRLEKLYGEAKTLTNWKLENDPEKITAARSKTHGEIVRDDKFNALSPTILRTNIANTESGIGHWNQELILGVRAMPRMIPQSLLVNNMVDAFKNRAIFKFLKFTRGELKVMDVLFGLNEARNDVRDKDNSWLNKYKNLAKKDKILRKFGKGTNPNCTVIITQTDAMMIKDKCGIDVRNVSNIKSMMNKYFFLAFGIYDTEAKMLDIIYDGENGFTTYSLRTMIADAKKDVDLLAMNKY